MYINTYYKLGQKWYLDLPEYLETGDATDLERIGSFHDFLEIIAEGKDSIHLIMDSEPFEGADELRLTGSSGGSSGGYYHIQTFNGRTIDLELWFNSIIYYRRSDLPKSLYVKLAESSSLG